MSESFCVDLAVQHVRPVEHQLGAPGELRVRRLDNLFGDREAWRPHEKIHGEIPVFLLQRRRRAG